MQKFTNITPQAGQIAKNNQFFSWWNKQSMNKPERRDLTISLLNENHEPVFVWKVKQAWPIKVNAGDLGADKNEVMIETLELVHEGLTWKPYHKLTHMSIFEYPPWGFTSVWLLNCFHKRPMISVSRKSAASMWNWKWKASEKAATTGLPGNCPVRSKYEDITLKRGVMLGSGIMLWCRKALEKF